MVDPLLSEIERLAMENEGLRDRVAELETCLGQIRKLSAGVWPESQLYKMGNCLRIIMDLARKGMRSDHDR